MSAISTRVFSISRMEVGRGKRHSPTQTNLRLSVCPRRSAAGYRAARKKPPFFLLPLFLPPPSSLYPFRCLPLSLSPLPSSSLGRSVDGSNRGEERDSVHTYRGEGKMEASFPQQCLFLLKRLWLLREVSPPRVFIEEPPFRPRGWRGSKALVTQWSGISSSLVGGRRERRRGRRTDEWGNPAEGGRESG